MRDGEVRMKAEGGRMKKRQTGRAPGSSLLPRPSSFARAGYSFPEVLFAVVVLGIGFIMIASVFPVAIQQSKASADETVAATAARSGVAVAAVLGQQQSTAATPIKMTMLPVTGKGGNPHGRVLPINTEEGWRAIRGNLIFNRDPRYGYVLLYRRDGDPSAARTWASIAQIYVITVHCRSSLRPADQNTIPVNGVDKLVPARAEQEFDVYDYACDLITTTTPPTNPNNLAPRRVIVKDVLDNPGGDGIDLIRFEPDPSKVQVLEGTPGQHLPLAVGEGCYVVMEKSGQIYRVGNARAGGWWELIPGSDVQNTYEVIDSGGGDSAQDAFVVGREWHAPYGPDDFVGPTQDISIFTTFVPVTQ
jgi:type II secretory pathway pseudopilin PulG